MKRVLGILALLLVGTSLAQSVRVWSENQALTRTPPGAADFIAGGGMDMTGVDKFSVTVCTLDGVNRLGGTGTIEFYRWDYQSVDAGHNPAASAAVTATGPCWTKDFEAGLPFGRMIVGTNGLTTTDAGTVTVRVQASVKSK